MPNKTCWGCKEDKPLDEFWKCQRNSDGRNNYCRECKEAKRKHYETTSKGLYEARVRLLALIFGPIWFGDYAPLQLDHRFSIKKGYQRRVPLRIIANPNNLQLLTATQNRQKGSRCSISIFQLNNEAQVSPELHRAAEQVGQMGAEQLRRIREKIILTRTT